MLRLFAVSETPEGDKAECRFVPNRKIVSAHVGDMWTVEDASLVSTGGRERANYPLGTSGSNSGLYCLVCGAETGGSKQHG